MIRWNSDVLTAAARFCPYLDCSYVTATTEATQVYNYYCSDCPIWSTTERSKFLFRTSLFSVPWCCLRRFAVLMGSWFYLLGGYHWVEKCYNTWVEKCYNKRATYVGPQKDLEHKCSQMHYGHVSTIPKQRVYKLSNTLSAISI